MNKERSLGVTLFALALMLPRAPGQSAPVSSPPSQVVTAEEVSLDIVVHDKKNRPVLDLKPAEIAVTDDGSPVTLKSLRLVSGKPDSDRLITLVFDRPTPNIKLTNADNLSKSAKAAATSQWSFYNQSIMKTARDTAAKIIKMIPESGSSFAVMDVAGRLRVEQGYTSDRKAILEAVNAATDLSSAPRVNGLSESERELIAMARTGTDESGKALSARDRALAESLTSVVYDSGRIAQDQHLPPSLAGLLALAQSQQKLAQRKVVIYFTFSADMEFDSHADKSIPSILGAANRAGVSFYIVTLDSLDTHGSRQNSNENGKAAMALSINNTIAGSTTTGNGASFGSTPGAPGGLGGAGAMQFAGGLGWIGDDDINLNSGLGTGGGYLDSSLQHLAQGTGGGFIDRDHLRKPLAQMVQDMTTYYEASYVPAIKAYDGSFRPVAVKPLRAGLKIRTQTGYLALPPHAGDGDAPQAFELPLLKILSAAPLPADQIFHTAILRMGDSPDGNVNTVAVEAPLSSLEIKEDTSTNLYSAHVSMMAVIKDSTGAVLQRFSEDIPRRGALRDLDEAKSDDAITLQRHFFAPPGKYVLEAAVLDDNSGKVGAQRIPFEIPEGTEMPSLSDVVLVRRTELARPEDDPAEPLAHGSDKVTPNLSGQLPSDARKVSFFFIAQTDPHAAAATLNIEIYKDGKLLAGSPLAAPLAGASGRSAYLPSIALSTLIDGAYEVKAVLSQGGKTAEAKTTFTLTGAPPSNLYAATAASETSSPEIAPPSIGKLVITFPTDSVERPAPDELKTVLADATKYAQDYIDSLPNFMCEKVTNRLVAKGARAEWIPKDKITERLVYFEHVEKRSLLELDRNGQKIHDGYALGYGVTSFGEFGGALKTIFQPSSKADFQWKQSGLLGDGKVQVFDYRVARENSALDVQFNANQTVTAGFHGQVFIDNATHNIRRITQVADNLPDNARIRSTAISVDYDYASINNHEYLVPFGAQVVVRLGRGETDLNEIEFRKFRRYGSNAKILPFNPNAKP